MQHIRQKIKVQGRVQGIGFRPYIHNLATELALCGHVSNRQSHVEIVLEGHIDAIQNFHKRLESQRLPQATITDTSIETLALSQSGKLSKSDHSGFQIIDGTSAEDQSQLEIHYPTDQAMCTQCQAELFSEHNHRYHYPFISCAQCGPRYSILKHLPFERINTSMDKFKLCKRCDAEYQNTQDRRFHAQTISCPECGPQLTLHDASASILESASPIKDIYQAIKRGEIVAIKGTSGIHLVCHAQNSKAVSELRKRKQRPDKPFAIMGLNDASFNSVCSLSHLDKALFYSPEAPIVLLPQKNPQTDWLKTVAPDCPDIGIFRPYSGLYRLLFEAARLDALVQSHGNDELTNQKPDKLMNDDVLDFFLVVTSANVSGDPLLSDNQECLSELSGVADLFLLHDLEIPNATDDSVVRQNNSSCMIRSGRGYAPTSLETFYQGSKNENSPCVLALGAHLKNSFCILQNTHALISPYIGDLSSRSMRNQLSAKVDQVISQHQLVPDIIACDLHPDFYSSALAETLSNDYEAKLIPVQHHQAHLAAVLAEHKLTEPCLGIALDGFGQGNKDVGMMTDSEIELMEHSAWGGELFHIKDLSFTRIGHLATLPLPGGDKATQDPQRLAYVVLYKINAQLAHSRFPELSDIILPLLETSYAPQTSSLGRWFDAVAAILGYQSVNSYEGQAALYLENLAHQSVTPYSPVGLAPLNTTLNLYPLVEHLLNYKDKAFAAKIFHVELAYALARWIQKHAQVHETKHIVCSGGCFQNRILTQQFQHFLTELGQHAYLSEVLPVNDSGLCLGQALIAQHTFTEETK